MKQTYELSILDREVECPACATCLGGTNIELETERVTVGQVVPGWFTCPVCDTSTNRDYRIGLYDIRHLVRTPI